MYLNHRYFHPDPKLPMVPGLLCRKNGSLSILSYCRPLPSVSSRAAAESRVPLLHCKAPHKLLGSCWTCSLHSSSYLSSHPSLMLHGLAVGVTADWRSTSTEPLLMQQRLVLTHHWLWTGIGDCKHAVQYIFDTQWCGASGKPLGFSC